MLRNFLTSLSGTVVAQLIMLASMLVLARIHDAEAFGQYQIFISSISVLMMVVALRFEVALLSAADGQVANLLRLTLRLSVVTSVVVAGAVLLVAPLILARFPALGSVIYLLPPSMLIAGLLQTLTYLPLRHRQYGLSARSKVAQSLGWSLAAFSMLPVRLGGGGLVVAEMFARLAAAVVLLRGSKGVLANALGPLPYREGCATVRAHRQFPTITFPGTLLSALAAAMVPYAFLTLFSLDTAGNYALVERVILLPAGILAAAVGQVFTGDFAKLFREQPGEVRRVFRRTLVTLSAIGILPCALGYIFVPSITPLIFGEHWLLAGELAAPAMLIALTTFVASPLNMVLIICGRFRLQLAWEIGRFAFLALCFAGFHAAQVTDPVMVMRMYAGATFLSYVVHLVLADRAASAMSRTVL